MLSALIFLSVLLQVAPSDSPSPSTVPTTVRNTADVPPSSVPTVSRADASKPVTIAQPRNPRVIFLTAAESPQCAAELKRLNRSGGDFERLRARGWKIGPGSNSHLQIVDKDAVPELVRKLAPRDYPTVAYVNGDEVVRSFTSGCTTPLDMWTFGWLAKGIDERPPGMPLEEARAETTGHYRLRGNHWSIDGDWSPARETVVVHLRSPNHARYLDASWAIDSWSYEELRSLHDDLHERYGGGVSASRQSSAARSANQFSASRKINGR